MVIRGSSSETDLSHKIITESCGLHSSLVREFNQTRKSENSDRDSQPILTNAEEKLSDETHQEFIGAVDTFMKPSNF